MRGRRGDGTPDERDADVIGRPASACSIDADAIAGILGLEPLPGEGGRYRETYRSEAVVTLAGPDGRLCRRSAGTAIYYLLSGAETSAPHSVPFPEIWHHYAGCAVEIIMTSPDGETRTCLLGDQFADGQRPQVIVPGNWVQTARVVNPEPGMPAEAGMWALTGTTMSPGFEFEDWLDAR